MSWLQLCYSRLEHWAKDTRDKLAERWMPAQALQDPACARHAWAQAQRVPAPPHAAVPSWKTGCKEQQPVAGAARH